MIDNIKNIFYKDVFTEVEPVVGSDGRYHGLYIIQDQVEYKFYIGRHCSDDMENDKYFGSGIQLKRAIRKYGKENFRMKYFHFSDNVEQLDKDEAEVIGILLDDVFHGDWDEFNKCAYNMRCNSSVSSYRKTTEVPKTGRVFNHSGELILGVNKVTGEVLVFFRVSDCIAYGFDTSTVSRNLVGRSKTAYRFKFIRTSDVAEIVSYRDSVFYDEKSKANYDEFMEYLCGDQGDFVDYQKESNFNTKSNSSVGVELGNGLRNLIDASIKDNLRIDVISIDGNTIRVAIKMNDFTFPVGDGSFRIIS